MREQRGEMRERKMKRETHPSEPEGSSTIMP